MKHRIFLLLLCLLLALLPAAGMAEAPAGGVDDLAGGILEFKAAQSGAKDVPDWVARVLPGAMGAGGEWYAIALSQAGNLSQAGDLSQAASYDLSACRAALLEYVANTTVRSATTRQKLALTFLAAGGTNEFVTETLADSIGQMGVMSWAWGLHLLNNGCESPAYTKEEVVKTLLELRKEDGGWAITGNAADVDATAMALQTLAPHRADAAVAEAAEAALALLSARQLESGGFASYGVENTESSAQVIIALCAWGIDPAGDTRFIKNGATVLDALQGFRLADGSFAHAAGGTYSESATVQAFLALTACRRLRAGEGPLYLLDGDAAAAVPGEMKTEMGYKPVATAVIGGIALAACIILLVMGKRHPKNFLAVAIIAGMLIAIVFVTDFQSAEEYYSIAAVEKTDTIGQVTLSIRCDKVAGQAAHIPADGVILAETAFPIAEGDTVYTVLTDAARAKGFHMEGSGANGLMYIPGIGNIYELDFGDLSGWVYLVNGESASVGCDQYVLRPGDRVEWHYTLALGKDIP